jgi:hypothetical protein
MARIAGRAVRAHRVSQRIGAGERVVTFGAQAAQFALPERGVIASMGLNVISDRRWHDMTAFKAKPTEWLDVKLVRTPPRPASGAVPAMNLRTVRHRECPGGAVLGVLSTA